MADKHDRTYIIEVIHGQGDARAFEVVHRQLQGLASLWFKDELELPRFLDHQVSGAVLSNHPVTPCVCSKQT